MKIFVPTLCNLINFDLISTRTQSSVLACLHDQTKVAYLEGQLFFSQSEFLKTFQTALTGWIKAGPPKKPLLFLSCKQAIYHIKHVIQQRKI